MGDYRIDFDRIGRTHNPPPVVISGINPARLADQIYKHARPYLRSTDIEIGMDLEKGNGVILAGFHTAGTFTISPTTPIGDPR